MGHRAALRGTGRPAGGCGIAAGSDPEAELAEAQTKFRAMQGALEDWD